MFTSQGMSDLQLDILDPATGVAELRWTSSLTDVLYQLYVNGEPAAATEDVEDQWRLEFTLPAGEQALIELIAVQPGEAETDFAGDLDGFTVEDANRCRLRWPKLATIHAPRDVANVYWDAATGTVDYDAPLAALPLWPDDLNRWGRGTSPRGDGGRGYDATAAPGRGEGARAYGERGFGALMAEWESLPLPAGAYQFAVRIEDEAGNASAAAVETITLDPPPRSAAQLEIEYNANDTVSLAWASSPDLA